MPKGPSPHLKKMDNLLSEWALRAGLPKRQRNLLDFKRWCNRLYDYDLWKRAKIEGDSGSPAAQISRKATFLIGRLVNSPAQVLSPHLYRFLLNALRRLMGRY
jgi:hypothetical protein